MKKKMLFYLMLAFNVISSFGLKLTLILAYKNELTVASDDLNYVKSAVVLLSRGIFMFHEFNEPTVFVMPLYPVFLAAVFRIFGYGIEGMQVVRIIQALISCGTIVIIFFIAKHLFDTCVALISSFLVAFYPPNITTSAYILTETLFTMLLCLLIGLSLFSSLKPGYWRFFIIGCLLALVTLIRPVIVLYPVILFIYVFIRIRLPFKRAVKLGAVMAMAFMLLMLPWWVRNYMEYSEFIPLAASSGNPMLQGTYINYSQTSENTTYYRLGKTAFETNNIEVEMARKRIKDEFKTNFIKYALWYTAGKTFYLWCGTFYWKEFFNIPYYVVLAFHYIILLGFGGMFILMRKNFSKYLLPVSVILYYNTVHCLYMTFDRYAFPVLPLVSIFCAYLLNKYIFLRFTLLKHSN